MKRPDPSKKRKKVTGVKSKRTGTRKKRRAKTSGLNTSGIMDIAFKGVALVGGALAGREGNALALKYDATLSPVLSGAIQAAVGFALPIIFPNEPILDFIGYGLIAQGGMVAAVSTIPVLQGINGPKRSVSYAYRKVNGNFNTVAGPNYRRNLIAGAFNTVAGTSTSRLNGHMVRRREKSLIAGIY